MEPRGAREHRSLRKWPESLPKPPRLRKISRNRNSWFARVHLQILLLGQSKRWALLRLGEAGFIAVRAEAASRHAWRYSSGPPRDFLNPSSTLGHFYVPEGNRKSAWRQPDGALFLRQMSPRRLVGFALTAVLQTQEHLPL